MILRVYLLTTIILLTLFGLENGYSQDFNLSSSIHNVHSVLNEKQLYPGPGYLDHSPIFFNQKPGIHKNRLFYYDSSSTPSTGNIHTGSTTSSGWWSRKYLIDYALIAVGTTGYVIGKDHSPRSRARIGPSYEPNNLLATFRSEHTNKPYLEEGKEETVPEYWIHRLLIGGGAVLMGMEVLDWRSGRGSGQQFHDTVIGYAQSVAITAAITDLTKPFFGRLRPDFTERALRFHCPDLTDPQYDPYCDSFSNQPLHEDPDEAQDLLDDGRKSFISGHSAHSFNLFGYTSLVIGGRYVWGSGATTGSRSFGIAGQIALMSAAAYISASRISDGRHHLSDTIAGALTGAAIANVSYWMRFNRDGELRRRPDNRVERTPRTNSVRNLAEINLTPWIHTEQPGGGLRVSLTF